MEARILILLAGLVAALFLAIFAEILAKPTEYSVAAELCPGMYKFCHDLGGRRRIMCICEDIGPEVWARVPLPDPWLGPKLCILLGLFGLMGALARLIAEKIEIKGY